MTTTVMLHTLSHPPDVQFDQYQTSTLLLLLCRFMVTEAYDFEEVDKTMMYYGTDLVREGDFPFNFYLLDLPHNMSGYWTKELVELWMSNMPTGKWPNWVVSIYITG